MEILPEVDAVKSFGDTEELPMKTSPVPYRQCYEHDANTIIKRTNDELTSLNPIPDNIWIDPPIPATDALPA